MDEKEKAREYYLKNREACLQRVKAYQAAKRDFKEKQKEYNTNYYYNKVSGIRKQKTDVGLLMKLKLHTISAPPIEKPPAFFTVNEDAWS
jgi:hypothetical protein